MLQNGVWDSSYHDLLHRVEAFLFYEADLLDERRFQEWLDMLADDFRYWVPVRDSVDSYDVAQELTQEGQMGYFDDTKVSMETRIRRYAMEPKPWAEYPPSRTRHLVANVRLMRVDGDEVEAHCNFIAYRTRLERDQDIFVGTRRDVVRREGDGFKLARRTIILDQSVLPSKSISFIL